MTGAFVLEVRVFQEHTCSLGKSEERVHIDSKLVGGGGGQGGSGKKPGNSRTDPGKIVELKSPPTILAQTFFKCFSSSRQKTILPCSCLDSSGQ